MFAMNRTHKYICIALSVAFTAATIVSFVTHEQTNTLLALLPIALQIILFVLIREKSLISHALTFIPAAALSIHLLADKSPWICIVSTVVVYAICRKKWPECRSTTSNWVGACAIMVVASLVASLFLCN